MKRLQKRQENLSRTHKKGKDGLVLPLSSSAVQKKSQRVTSREDVLREGATTASTESLPRSKTSNSSHSTNQVEKVVALYDFEAENDDELSFKKGSIIVVVKKQHEGWWVGNCDGSTGVFPSNYVESVGKSEDVKPVAVKRNSMTTASSPTPSLNSNSSGKAPEKLVNLSSSVERLAINDDDDDSPPPQQMGFSYLPRMEPGASLSSILRTNTKKPPHPKSNEDEHAQRTIENDNAKECGDCGCTDFTANVFKPKSCNNCFHIH